MPLTCPNCGFKVFGELPCACAHCGQFIDQGTSETGYTSEPPDRDLLEAGYTSQPPEGVVPSIVNPAAAIPQCPALLIVIGSTLLCAIQGAMSNLGKPGGFSMNTSETTVGAIAGFLIGLALACDHWLFQRKRRTLVSISFDDPDARANIPKAGDRPSDWVPIAMLILPIVAGMLLWLAKPLRLNETHLALIGSGTIVLTAILGYVSTRQMTLRLDRHSTYHGAFASPAFVYLGMLFLWLICYPAHFVTRWRMGGRNLILPALFATAVYLSPVAQDFLVEPELPSGDDAEVLSLLKQMLEGEPMMRPVTVKQPIETSFDAGLQVRKCQCTITTKFGDENVPYKIDWQDRGRGKWQIYVLDRLPMVHTKEVIEGIKKALEDEWIGIGNRRDLTPLQVQLPTQTGYDALRQQRIGSATVRTQKGDAPLTFIVEWVPPDRKLFQIRFVAIGALIEN